MSNSSLFVKCTALPAHNCLEDVYEITKAPTAPRFEKGPVIGGRKRAGATNNSIAISREAWT